MTGDFKQKTRKNSGRRQRWNPLIFLEWGAGGRFRDFGGHDCLQLSASGLANVYLPIPIFFPSVFVFNFSSFSFLVFTWACFSCLLYFFYDLIIFIIFPYFFVSVLRLAICPPCWKISHNFAPFYCKLRHRVRKKNETKVRRRFEGGQSHFLDYRGGQDQTDTCSIGIGWL